MRKVNDKGINILFKGLYAVQMGYMLFRRVLYCCSGGLYEVKEGFMLFRRVIYGCSRTLYTFQVGYMLFRMCICCSGGLYAVQEGYMLKKIMMFIVATNVIASLPPNTNQLECQTARARIGMF